MADTTKQEGLKQKLLYFFEKKLTELSTKFEADINSLEKMKYEYFDSVVIKYREIEEECKKQESEEREKPEKEKKKPEKKSDEPEHSKVEKKKIDQTNGPKAPAATTKRPKSKEKKSHDKTEIYKEKKETKQKSAVQRATTAKTATKKDTGKKPVTAKADPKTKTTTKKEAVNAKKVSKLDAAKQKILDLDIKFLKPLTKANVPTSIKFYFECCGIIMSKRLAVPDNFGYLEINKETKVRYYSPLGWTTMMSYITSNSYGSFFDTINDFQEKLDGNKLNINNETLELLRPFLDSKTCMDEPLFSDDVAKKIGGDACRRLAAFCRSISDYVYAVRDIISKK